MDMFHSVDYDNKFNSGCFGNNALCFPKYILQGLCYALLYYLALTPARTFFAALENGYSLSRYDTLLK